MAPKNTVIPFVNHSDNKQRKFRLTNIRKQRCRELLVKICHVAWFKKFGRAPRLVFSGC
eukprot:UN00811